MKTTLDRSDASRVTCTKMGQNSLEWHLLLGIVPNLSYVAVAATTSVPGIAPKIDS